MLNAAALAVKGEEHSPSSEMFRRGSEPCNPAISLLVSAALGDHMARVTVEDCLVHEENRFALVVLAARRARILMKGAPALVPNKNRESVSALREIAAQKVKWNRPVVDAVNEFIVETRNAEIR